MKVFPTSAIRSLARSEEMFAETHNFVALTAHMTGPVDIDAMSDAFDALLRAHPVLAGRLEQLPDGRHQIVVDDLMPAGLEVVDSAAGPVGVHLDQRVALAHLRLTMQDGQGRPTFYIHHCLADGHHQFSFVEELFSWYTELVDTGTLREVAVQPAPVPLESVLAERGIGKQQRSGLERFIPAMYAYDLPPSRRAVTDAATTLPSHVPVARCRFSEPETRALISFCRRHRLRTNAVVSAAILMAEWRLRGTPHIPVPYIYPVDLRYFLTPPLSATACTNPLGVATYLAQIDRHTDVTDLARAIAETFQADLADGVIQQSLLHFSPQYVGNPPGLPDIVMFTDNGPVPALRTPAGMAVTGCHSDMYFGVTAGIDMYSSGIIADRLFIEHHSHAPGREESIAQIRSLLCGIAERQAATGVG